MVSATARTKARFARTALGSFWLGLSNLFSIGVLAAVYGTVFKVQNFTSYVVYLGIGLVVWNSISSAVGGAPNLFEHNRDHLHNTNLHPIFYTLKNGIKSRLLCSFFISCLSVMFFPE